MTNLRVVFAGSPAAAVPSLLAIARSSHDIAAVITREDAVLGRKRIRTPTPVARAAEQLDIPVIAANSLAGEPTERILRLQPDLGVIVAYGGLVREPLLSAPELGWINLHFSVLPRWRGAAPVQRAIIAGDDVTGASVFQLVEELDAGPIFGTMTQAIGRNETAGHLMESLSVSGAELLVGVMDALGTGTARASEQSGDVTFAPKLTIEDGRVDWAGTAASVHNRIRGVTPEPGAFTIVDGDRLKIIDAARARDTPRLTVGRISADGKRVFVGTASEPIELLTVQPAGKRPMPAADWLRGRRSAAETAAT